MSYAFGKMRFFWVWIILFFIVKRVSFFSAKSPSIILVLFWPNLNKPNNWNFFIKSMSYPLKKCDFLDFEKCCFLRSKKILFSLQSQKALFLVLFWSNLNKEKNGSFRKADFLDFEKFCSLRPNKVFLSLQSQKALFLGLVWSNLNKEKIGIFWPKAWVNPFEKKCDFWTLKNSVFIVKKGFFFHCKLRKYYF